MLTPGTYKLTRTVTNPHPDRRKTTDWRAMQEWRAGLEFLVEESDIRRFPGYTRIMLVGYRWRHHNIAAHQADQYHALEAALTPCSESDAAMFTALGVDNGFAEWLVESGRVTKDLFRRLWLEYEAAEAPYPAPAAVLIEQEVK